MQVDLNKDKGQKIYEYLLGPFEEQTKEGGEVARRAMLDWSGYVDFSKYDPHYFHLHPNLMFRLTELVASRDYMELFKKRPFLPFVANKEQYRGLTDALTFYIDKDMEIAHYAAKMEMVTKQIITGGTVALFPYYRKRRRRVPIMIPKMGAGNKADIDIIEDIRYDEGLDFKVLPVWRFAIADSAGYEWWNAEWAMFREYITRDQAENIMKTLKARKKISRWDYSRIGDVGQDVVEQLSKQGISEREVVVLDHIITENRYIRIINQTDVIQDDKFNPWISDDVQGLSRTNMILFKNITDVNPRSCYGVSMNKKLGGPAAMYEASLDMLINMGFQRQNHIITYNQDAGIDGKDLVSDPMGPRLARGESPDDISILQLPQISADFWQLPEIIKKQAFDILSVQDFEMGAAPSPKQQSEVMHLLDRNVSSKLAYRYAVTYEQPLSVFALHLAVIAQKFVPIERALRVLNEKALDLVLDPQSPEGLVLDPRRLEGGFKMGFEASAKIAERAEKLGSLEKLLNLLANDQWLAPPTQIILREMIFRAQPGISKEEVDKLMAPTTAMLQQMQQQGQGNQPLVPPQATEGQPAQTRLGNYNRVLPQVGQPIG